MSDSPDDFQASSKRVKLEEDEANETIGTIVDKTIEEELDGDHCSICLQLLLDRTVIPECSHEFCFDCILTWTEQSRRCPLCTRTIGPYLIHHIRSNFDYQKFHLLPLRSSPPPIQPLRPAEGHSIRRRSGQERRWGRRGRRDQDVADELERAIDRRRWIYHNHLYAKHVASNTLTRYRPFPTPAQFSASKDYISRATIFIRRELRVWVNLDVEFLTTFILSLMKVIDIRSESAIKLLAEFLDMDKTYCEGRRFPNAEQFAHELYSFLRSPYKSLSAYDMNVQYDVPEDFYFDNRRANETFPRLTRTHSCERSPARGRSGGDQTETTLNIQTTNADKRLSSSRSPTIYAEILLGDGAMRSSSCNASRTTGPSILYTTEYENNWPSHTTSAGSQERENSKGKQRATEANDLATRVTAGHCHGDRQKIEPVRSDGEPIEKRGSVNTSVDQAKCHHGLSKDDNDHRPPLPRGEMPSRNSVRARPSRNPLLIAQAHLSEAHGKPRSKNPLPLTSTPKDYKADLRGLPENSHERPLSRITNSKLPIAPHEDASTDSSSGPNIPLNKTDLQTKLLHRLGVEHVGKSSQESRRAEEDTSSICLTPKDKDASGVNEELGTADLEAKARVRARLMMKLTVEKHLHTPTAHINSVDDRTPEANIDASDNREESLRTVLEKRRRHG